jgi:hypothetical protein
MLTKDAIFAADDLPREKVSVPEWGGHVYVRSMTGTERDAFEESINAGGELKNFANFRARLAVLTVVDAEGKRLFDDKDVKALGKKSAAALTRVFNAATKLSGLSTADVAELAKNSDDGPSDGST